MLKEIDFTGNERFSVRRRLGVGGVGVVYEAFDNERGASVALKTLKWSDAQALYRFKQEFRSLVDISHPNLVTLHELVSAGETWMLTMELIHGRSFLDHVRGLMVSGPHRVGEPGSVSDYVHRPANEPSPPPDFVRLELALRQLCLGIQALHDAGKLHRDIKPSNVLVESSGRVVLLDFGLITDVNRASTQTPTTGDNVVGTAAYMAPEQALSGPVGTASDWYSVGVMLYEALTGILPYRGSPLEILMDKQQSDPIPPRALLPSLPLHLSELCTKLLARSPAQRPVASTIIAALGGSAAKTPYPTFTTRSHAPRFFGRRDELTVLKEALESTRRDGRPALVAIHSDAGMGKSALLHEFAELAANEHKAEVMLGRCYESESVPFKALDNLIDSLASRLAAMPRAQAEAIVPRDRFSLSRLFPVLKRVDAIASTSIQTAFSDVHDLRARAGVALGELLGRYAEKQPIILMVDDMHWGDIDSASLLVDLLSAHDAPPILLVISYRTGARDNSAALEYFFANLSGRGANLSKQTLHVGALSSDDATACSLALLLADDSRDGTLAYAIAGESQGNPQFIAELVRYARSGLMRSSADDSDLDDDTELPAISLDDAIRARLTALGPSARRVLELIALSGRPVRKHAVYRAAGLDENDTAIAVLRAGRVVMAAGSRGSEDVEIANDRLRSAVVDSIDSTKIAVHHAELAAALEREGGVDPEILAYHYRRAGQLIRAGELSAKAAERAFEALAFERAATLYRVALDELEPTDSRRPELVERLGDAAWSSGHLREAATAYLEAAQDAPPAHALELRRRAAEQFLRSAQVEEGLAAVATVLKNVSLSMSATPRRAVLTLLLRRMRVRLRGLKFVPRDESEIAPTELRRVDTCWTIASSIGPIDTVIGASLQTMHVLLALNAGERSRISRALAVECFYSAIYGRKTERRTRKLVAYSTKLAAEVQNPATIGISGLAASMCEYQLGNWRLALEHALKAIHILENEATAVYFEIASGRRWIIDCLSNLGELSEVESRVNAWLRDAERRGDAHLETEMTTGLASLAWLIRDEPEISRERALASRAMWNSKRYLLQHYTSDLALAHAALYQGDGPAAYKLIQDAWSPLKRSFLFQLQALSTEAWFLRGRAAVAAHHAGDQAALKDAERCANKLRTLKVPGGPGLSHLVAGLVADAKGNRAAALEQLQTAVELLSSAELRLFAESARFLLGSLRGEAGGDDDLVSATRWFASHNVVNPTRLAGVFAPHRTPPRLPENATTTE